MSISKEGTDISETEQISSKVVLDDEEFDEIEEKINMAVQDHSHKIEGLSVKYSDSLIDQIQSDNNLYHFHLKLFHNKHSLLLR